MKALRVSERFTCRDTGQHRDAQRRLPAAQTPADPDAALRAWLRVYAKAHPPWGLRLAYHDARGEGWTANHKKIQRPWREEGLRVPQRRRRNIWACPSPNPR
jgi:putative transposase